jgi:nicotinamidase-related amidase
VSGSADSEFPTFQVLWYGDVIMKPVLLVIDAQNGWLGMSDGLKDSVERRIDRMVEAISIFRKANSPIIFTYHSQDDIGMVPGTNEFDLFPGVKVNPSDGKVVKTYMNAFNKTDLESQIHDMGCDTVILIGLSAMYCVHATYLGAFDRDLVPYLIKGAVAGPDEGSVEMVEKISDTLSLKAISQILGLGPNMMVGHGRNPK